MIPHFLRHYSPWVSRFVIYDNNSTDGSVLALRAHPGVTVRSFDVDGGSFVLKEQQISETVWKQSRGVADWVVMIDMDEFLFHPDMPAYLQACKADNVTAIESIGFEMVADDLPTDPTPLPEVVTDGLRWPFFDKLCIFDPNALKSTGYGPGRHKALPTGVVRYAETVRPALLHYKMLGRSYYVDRTLTLSRGLGPIDIANGWGASYRRSREEVGQTYDQYRALRRPVPGLAGAPSFDELWSEERRLRNSPAFDSEWYLDTYPDVRAAGIDPVIHFVSHGRAEGRRPHGRA